MVVDPNTSMCIPSTVMDSYQKIAHAGFIIKAVNLSAYRKGIQIFNEPAPKHLFLLVNLEPIITKRGKKAKSEAFSNNSFKSEWFSYI